MSQPQICVHFYSSWGFRGTDPGWIWAMIWSLPASTGEKYCLKENYFCVLWVFQPDRRWPLCSVVVRSREGGSAHRELSQKRTCIWVRCLDALQSPTGKFECFELQMNKSGFQDLLLLWCAVGGNPEGISFGTHHATSAYLVGIMLVKLPSSNKKEVKTWIKAVIGTNSYSMHTLLIQQRIKDCFSIWKTSAWLITFILQVIFLCLPINEALPIKVIPDI